MVCSWPSGAVDHAPGRKPTERTHAVGARGFVGTTAAQRRAIRSGERQARYGGDNAYAVESPHGLLGQAAARFMHNIVPGEIASKTLHYFKSLALTGEIPATERQPAARRDPR
jgi:hypothetical protein